MPELKRSSLRPKESRDEIYVLILMGAHMFTDRTVSAHFEALSHLPAALALDISCVGSAEYTPRYHAIT